MRNRAITVVAVAAALIGLGTVLPASAAQAPAAAGLDCSTWVHNNDPLTGGVDCKNNTNAPIRFHADIVCGWAPDVTGNSVTVLPGGYEQSVGHCPVYSSGIGRIGWTVE